MSCAFRADTAASAVQKARTSAKAAIAPPPSCSEPAPPVIAEAQKRRQVPCKCWPASFRVAGARPKAEICRLPSTRPQHALHSAPAVPLVRRPGNLVFAWRRGAACDVLDRLSMPFRPSEHLAGKTLGASHRAVRSLRFSAEKSKPVVIMCHMALMFLLASLKLFFASYSARFARLCFTLAELLSKGRLGADYHASGFCWILRFVLLAVRQLSLLFFKQ